MNGAVVQIRASAGVPILPTLGEAMFDVASLTIPSSWVDQPCIIRQGCDRTDARCIQLGNQDNNLGIGKRMPTRNPEIDTATP